MKDKMLKEISKQKTMVLGTSYQDEVSVRSVSVIALSNKVYFQTSIYSQKYEQIMMNPKVGLTSGYFQLQGIAKDLGPWEENELLCELYKRRHKDSYESYGELKEERVIEVTIINIKQYAYEGNEAYIYSIDVESDQVEKIKQAKYPS